MDDHIVIVADTDGVIRQWNATAERVIGHPASVVLGRPVDVLIPEHLRDRHWAGFHRAMREPKLRDLAADLPVVCADGQTRSFAGRLLVLIDAFGTAVGAMAILAPTGTTGRHPFG